MESLSPLPAATAPPPPAPPLFAELEREWSAFFAELEAHAANPAAWFSPERAQRVEAMLRRGQDWLQAQERSDARFHPERRLYAMHLRRLLPALQHLQQELLAAAARLCQKQQRLQALRDWAAQSLPAPRPGALRR